MEEQTFRIERSFVRITRFGVWFFGILSALPVVLAVISFVESPENTAAIVVYLLMMLAFIGFAYGAFRVTEQFNRAPISVDQDGIWSTEIGKSRGLIEWAEVTSIKERQYGQRLELLDFAGDSLMKLEYQLEGFADLRRIVLERIRRPEIDIQCPVTYGKSVSYHAFTILVLFGFSALSYYVSRTQPIIGLLGLLTVILIVYDYATTAANLTIERRTIHVGYPHRTRTFGISEISSIRLSDQFVQGSRIPEVIVASHTSQKPIRLKQIGVDSAQLYDLLVRWNDERLFN